MLIRFLNLNTIAKDIEDDFKDRSNEAFDIFKFYAAEVVKYFLLVQASLPAEVKGEFWTNHTFKAARAFFAHSYKEKDIIGLIMDYETNLAPYIKYLEFYYGKRFAALPPLLERFYPMILHDIQVLYGDV